MRIFIADLVFFFGSTMAKREYTSLNERARAIAGEVVFPRSKENAYEYRVRTPTPHEPGQQDLHVIGLTPELFYQSNECTTEKDECVVAMRAGGYPYAICFNSNQGPVVHSGGGRFEPENPWDFCLHIVSTAAVLIAPGSTAKSRCLVVGQDLMRDLGTEIGLPQAGPMPRSKPSAGEPWVLRKRVTTALLRSIESIEECPLEGTLKKLYVEGKALETIALALAHIFGADRQHDTRPSLRPREIRRMHEARDIVDSRLDDLPGLAELARAVGTSTTALKKAFRAVFGVPVFEYARTERLRRAHVLLSQGDFSVGEVAARVGFQSLGHFGAAYKKLFGFLPSTTTRHTQG